MTIEHATLVASPYARHGTGLRVAHDAAELLRARGVEVEIIVGEDIADAADLAGTVHDVREEIRKLPQLHDQLWDLFKPVKNKKDMEQFEQFLADEAIRQEFYERLKTFSRCLHISLSSDKLFEVFEVFVRAQVQLR